jgi:subtilisin-like proprotein convertase family protein
MRPICAVVAFVCAASSARADTLVSTLQQPLRELSHTVDIAINDGIATCTVRRVFVNDGTVADEAGLEIDLPPGAAATALRIRARSRWYDGELLEAQEAARRYAELTGYGAHVVKDPALLQWLWADKLFLQVFPVLPGAASTVEYTLTMPTRYDRGRVFVAYPHVVEVPLRADPGAARPLAKPVVTLHPSWGDVTTKALVDDRIVVVDTPVVLQAPPAPPWVAELGVPAHAVVSAIDVPVLTETRDLVSQVTVDVDIDHTWRTDLRLRLVTPDGQQLSITTAPPADSRVAKDNNDIRGGFTVLLPQARPAHGRWRLVVEDGAARDVGTLTSWSLVLSGATKRFVARDTPQFIADQPESQTDGGSAQFSIAGPDVDVLAARLGAVTASNVHAFSRFEVDMAPQLAALPKRAQVVFVIDASHSQGVDGIAAQLTLLRAYLLHVPDADVEVVVYRRAAARVFGRFVRASDLETLLQQTTALDALVPGNGSALDAGVQLAVALFEQRPGPQRLVLLTDELLRPSFQPAWVDDALRALSKEAVVHVVAPAVDHNDEVTLLRDDSAALAPLAAAHHGIFARVRGFPVELKPLAPVALGLVRPVQLDHVRLVGLPTADIEPPTVLHEGDGFRFMQALPKSVERVVVEGKLWGDAFRRVVRVDDRFSHATAAFVFGEDEHGGLSAAEMMRVALFGKAVSPVTSYLAIEPGVRPSTVGLRYEGRGIGTDGISLRGNGSGGGGGTRHPPDLRALVDATACFNEHRAQHATLDVFTTRDEVVDVRVRDGDGAFAACVVEAVWATRLSAAFNLDHEHFVVVW